LVSIITLARVRAVVIDAARMLVAVVDSLALIDVFTNAVNFLEAIRALAKVASFRILAIIVPAAIVAFVGALVDVVAEEAVAFESGKTGTFVSALDVVASRHLRA